MAEAEHACLSPGLSKYQVTLAIKALLEHQKNDSRVQKKRSLFNVASKIRVLMTVWRIPPTESVLKIWLPHSARHEDVEVCLFSKDEPNMSAEQTSNFYMKLLQKSGVNSVTRVIPYQTLKREYKPYEAKLKLLRSYDLFLSDSRIRRLLPSHLGRHFYATKKIPLSVDLQCKNLGKEMNRFISGTAMHVSNKGNCNTVLVGNTAMSTNDLVDNVFAVASIIAAKFPGGWGNVKIMHVKTDKSVALPLYTADLDAIATVLNRKNFFKSPADTTEQSKEQKKKNKKKKRDKPASAGDVPPAKKAKVEADGELGELPTMESSDIAADVKTSKKSSAKKKKAKVNKPDVVIEEKEASAVEEEGEEVAAADVIAAVEAVGDTCSETLGKTPEETPSKKAKRKRKRNKSLTPAAAGAAAPVMEESREETTMDTDEAAVASFLSEVRRNTPLKTPAKKEEEEASAVVAEGCPSPGQPRHEEVVVKTPKRRGVKTPQKPTADMGEENGDVVMVSGVSATPVIDIISEIPAKSGVKTLRKSPKQNRAKTPSKLASDDNVGKEVKEIAEVIDVDLIPVMAPLSETPVNASVKTPGKTPKQTKPKASSMPTVKGSDGSEDFISAAGVDDGKVPFVIDLSDTEETTSAKTPVNTPKPRRTRTPSKPDAAKDFNRKISAVHVDLSKDAVLIELSDTEEVTTKKLTKTPELSRTKTPAKQSAATRPSALSSEKAATSRGKESAAPGMEQVAGDGSSDAAAAEEEDDIVMDLPARTPRRKAALAASEAITVLHEKRRSSGRRTRSSDASASETGSECGSDVSSGLEDGVVAGLWAARRGEGGRRKR